MIGQEYFDLRSRLESALLALRDLAAESAGGDDQIAAIDNLIKGLKEPFLLVIVGETTVEKSTFLNALAGADLSMAGLVPTPEKILLIQHGSEQKRTPVTRTLEELCVPVDFFNNFHVVDTPGTGSIENEHEEITRRFVPSADLMIFVFSALKPWGDTAWRFLEKIHEQLRGNVIFVLQQSDQREPEEIQSILAYMKRLSVQRFGRDFPIFPVSANRAYLARSSGLDSERLLAESGFNRLEQHISGVVNSSNSHLGKLAETLKAARLIHDSVQSRVENLIGQRVKRAGILRTIDSELAAQAQHTFDKIAAVTEASAAGLQKSVQDTLAGAAAQLKSRAVLRSLFHKELPAAKIESLTPDDSAGASPEHWNRAAAIFEVDVCSMADQLRPRLADGLNLQTGEELKPDAIFWAAQRGCFLAQASGIQERAFSGLNISQHLAPALASSRRLALRRVIFTMSCVLVALALGASGSWIFAGCAAGAAVLVFLILGRTESKILVRAYADCESHLSPAPMKMKNLLDQQLREETQNLYESFNKVLLPVRETLNEQERHQTKLNREMKDLGRIFEGLETKLEPVANPPA